jgi:hypothetical protein
MEGPLVTSAERLVTTEAPEAPEDVFGGFGGFGGFSSFGARNGGSRDIGYRDRFDEK